MTCLKNAAGENTVVHVIGGCFSFLFTLILLTENQSWPNTPFIGMKYCPNIGVPFCKYCAKIEKKIANIKPIKRTWGDISI